MQLMAKHPNQETDIATFRLNRPKGRFSEKTIYNKNKAFCLVIYFKKIFFTKVGLFVVVFKSALGFLKRIPPLTPQYFSVKKSESHHKAGNNQELCGRLDPTVFSTYPAKFCSSSS